MDQSTLVENQIDDGRRFIERFAADGNRVKAAFWVKTSEEGIWFLYVVTDLVDDGGPAVAYRAVHNSLHKLDELCLSSSEIKVVSPNDAIAKDVLAIMARYPGRLSTRFSGKTLGAMEVELTYLYPPQIFTRANASTMTRDDIGREVVRLMSRSPGVLQRSHVTLMDDTSFDGIPFSLQLGSQKALVVQFIADGEASPRVVPLDEIASLS